VKPIHLPVALSSLPFSTSRTTERKPVFQAKDRLDEQCEKDQKEMGWLMVSYIPLIRIDEETDEKFTDDYRCQTGNLSTLIQKFACMNIEVDCN
jgi:hypothetical protein